MFAASVAGFVSRNDVAVDAAPKEFVTVVQAWADDDDDDDEKKLSDCRLQWSGQFLQQYRELSLQIAEH